MKTADNRLCRFLSWSGRRICLALLALCAFAGEVAAQTQTEYTFAVVPQFEQRKLFSIWRPIVDELSRRTGLKLKLVATLSVTEFEREMTRGSFDFVYTNPYHILREVPRQGYLPLVRDQDPLRGIVVVARDSPIKSPAELNGQRFAIPSFNALGASLLVRADLERLFKAKVDLVNAQTHSSVYLQVANGLVPAGGGVEKTLSEQDPAVRDLLRVLYTTREMPSHPVSAHPRVPVAQRAALQKALLSMGESVEGYELLAKIPMPKPVVTSIQDYLPMRDWGLDRYWVD